MEKKQRSAHAWFWWVLADSRGWPIGIWQRKGPGLEHMRQLAAAGHQPPFRLDGMQLIRVRVDKTAVPVFAKETARKKPPKAPAGVQCAVRYFDGTGEERWRYFGNLGVARKFIATQPPVKTAAAIWVPAHAHEPGAVEHRKTHWRPLAGGEVS